MATEELETTRAFGVEEATVALGAVSGEATQMGGTLTCPVCATANPALETYCVECGFLLTSQPGELVQSELEPACTYSLVDDRTGRRYPLQAGDNLIGRETGEVLLVDTTVSRRHAVLTVSEAGLTVTDQGSTNGTRVDGTGIPAQTPHPLAPGATLQFGNVTLRLEGPAGAVPAEVTVAMGTEVVPPAETGAAAERGPEFAILRSDGTHPLDIRVYEGSQTVGRRPGNDHVIEGDPFVSGRHARITCSEGQVLIEDLGSTNGTFVNGRRLAANEPLRLADGDEIAIGKGKYLVSIRVPGDEDAEDERVDVDELEAGAEGVPADE